MKITEAEVDAIYAKSERKIAADPAYADAMHRVTDCLRNGIDDDRRRKHLLI
jgi:hypothetical protein